MMITVDTITRDQRSILLYAETCCVDHGGLLEGPRMNKADHDAMTELQVAGILISGRVPAKLLGTFQRSVTHWCTLTDAGWTLAHQLRRAAASKPNAARERVDAYFAERDLDDKAA